MSMNENEVIDQALDYKKYPHLYGKYELTRLTQQSGSQNITVTAGGGVESVFDIPVKTFNLSKSYLSFTISPDAAGAAYIYSFVDGVVPIKQIQLYTRSGIFLCDIPETNVYTNIIARRENLSYDVETWDSLILGGAGATLVTGIFEGLYPCNQTANANYRPDATTGHTSYLEPAYVLAGNNTTQGPVINCRIPLTIFKNTILAENKDIFFGGEIVELKIIWANPNRVFLNSTSAANVAGPTAYATGMLVTNLIFYLALETDLLIDNMVKSLVMRQEGLQFLVPFVYYNKIPITATGANAVQTITTRYNRPQGMKLKKIYWAPYSQIENSLTAYDHNNKAAAKVVSFNTFINNDRISQYDYSVANYDDWLAKRKYTRGTAIYSSDEYYFNWVYVEDFTDNNSKLHKFYENSDNYIEGLDLTNELKFDIYATVANVNLNHYVYAVTEKLLEITPGGIRFI